MARSIATTALLRAHPRSLSLSELFWCLGDETLNSGQYGAVRFWDLLTRPHSHMIALLGDVSVATWRLPSALASARPGQLGVRDWKGGVQ
jgi:hypothetical protein